MLGAPVPRSAAFDVPVARVWGHGGRGRLQAAPPGGFPAFSSCERPLPRVSRGVRGSLRRHLRRLASRGARSGRQVPRMRRARARFCPRALRRVYARVPPRLLVHGTLLLPELPRQTIGALDAVAGGVAPRAGCPAPPGGAHDPQAAPRVVPVPPVPPRRSRPRRGAHGDRRHAYAHGRAHARGGDRGLHPDARVARQLAPAHSYDCDRRRLPA